MSRQDWTAVGVGLAVVLVLLLAVLVGPPDPGVPCVDVIPATADCAPDSPAVLEGR